jgi:hypothetical protein
MLVKISAPEEIGTPSGLRKAWRVEGGKREVAWYDAENPTILLRYFNRMETWTLVAERELLRKKIDREIASALHYFTSTSRLARSVKPTSAKLAAR